MAFAIVQLESTFWTIVLKDDIKHRIGNMGQCLILNKHENVIMIGCHNNYTLLNEMCKQHNRRSMIVSVCNNFYTQYIGTGQLVPIIKSPTLTKLQQCEKIESPKLVRRRLFEEIQPSSVDMKDIVTLNQDEPSESFDDTNKKLLQIPSCKELRDTHEITISDIEIVPPPLVPITSSVQTEKAAQSRKPKKNYCKYCGEKKTCLSRHIIAKHKEEPEVKEYVNFSKSNPKRAQLLSKLRRDGNFEYGFQNKSDMIPARMIKNIDSSKYVVCPYCKIILTKEALRRHVRIYCSNSAETKARGALKLSKGLQEKIDDRACDILKQCIFPTLREDAVKETLRFDRLLIIYANEMCAKYRSQHHYAMIRNRLILMAKLLIHIRSIDPLIQEFKNIFNASNFTNIIICINKFGEYDEETGVYLKPTLPTTIGTALKYIIHLFKAECIIHGNHVEKQNAEEFLHLLTTRLPAHVNKNAAESLLKLKRQKHITLPSTEDIKTLNLYILRKRTEYFEKLESRGFDYKNWLNLAKYTLISILIFNRRRTGELQRALISDLKSIQGIDKNNQDIFNSLSEKDKEAVHNYKRFTIRGKLAKGVPVLLHINMYNCVMKILHHQKDAGVHQNNPYIFGLPQRKTIGKQKVVYRHLSATDLMREFSTKCGASNPKTLRATQLRKHIATKSVSLNLNDNEISNLQSFLGHADKIHKEYYRQPIIIDDIVKMSKLLLIAQGDEVQSTSQPLTISSLPSAPSDTLETSDTSITLDTAYSISALDVLPGPSTSQSSWPSSSKCISFIPNLSETVPKTQESEYFQSSSDEDYTPVDDRSGDESEEERPQKKRLLDINLGKFMKRTWATPEKHTMLNIFDLHIKREQIPSVLECADAVKQYPVLRSRTIPQMQMWVRNYLKRSNKSGFSKRTWSTPERRTVRKLFTKYIECSSETTYPSVEHLQNAIDQYPELKNRTPRKLRSHIQHQRKLFRNQHS